MKRKDSRGRPLDYEHGQIHEQFDMMPPPVNGEEGHCAGGFRAQLNRLVDTYKAQGKTAATLYVTAEQEREIRGFIAYPENPLRYRGHLVAIVVAPEKL